MPSTGQAGLYSDLVEQFGATVPTRRLEDIAVRGSGAPPGTTDAFLGESRRERA